MPTKRAVRELHLHPFNSEVYGEPDAGLAASLSEFGLLRAVEINSKNQILSGARRWAAAKELGWKDIETEIRQFKTDEEEKKFVLLANAYREVKSVHLRQREADAYLQLHETGSMTTGDLAEQATRMAKARGTAPPRTSKPSELAAKAAGLDRSTYAAAKFVTDPSRGEAEIDRSRGQGLISGGQASALKRELTKERAAFQRNEAGAKSTASNIRSRLRDAEFDHGYSEEEKRERETAAAVDRAIDAGKRFVQSVRELRHSAHAKHLTAKDAFRLAGVLTELQDNMSKLMEKSNVRVEQMNALAEPGGEVSHAVVE